MVIKSLPVSLRNSTTATVPSPKGRVEPHLETELKTILLFTLTEAEISEENKQKKMSGSLQVGKDGGCIQSNYTSASTCLKIQDERQRAEVETESPSSNTPELFELSHRGGALTTVTW